MIKTLHELAMVIGPDTTLIIMFSVAFITIALCWLLVSTLRHNQSRYTDDYSKCAYTTVTSTRSWLSDCEDLLYRAKMMALENKDYLLASHIREIVDEVHDRKDNKPAIRIEFIQGKIKDPRTGGGGGCGGKVNITVPPSGYFTGNPGQPGYGNGICPDGGKCSLGGPNPKCESCGTVQVSEHPHTRGTYVPECNRLPPPPPPPPKRMVGNTFFGLLILSLIFLTGCYSHAELGKEVMRQTVITEYCDGTSLYKFHDFYLDVDETHFYERRQSLFQALRSAATSDNTHILLFKKGEEHGK